MTDTPQHVQDLQLKIWLSKSLGERLYLSLKFNEEIFLFGKKSRDHLAKINKARRDAASEQTAS